MDSDEARAILNAELAEFEKRSYDVLVSLIGQPKATKTIAGRAGAQYQLDTRVVWDSREGGDVRVLGGIDDGGWRAFLPMAGSILKSRA